MRVGGRLGVRGLAEEVVLLDRRERRVAVGGADEPELVGVGAEALGEQEPVQHRLASVFGLEHGVGLGLGRSRLPASQVS